METSPLRQTTHDHRSSKNFSITIIETIANELEIDPTEQPLHLDEHIDLAAVNELYHAAQTDDHHFQLTFDYKHLQITINTNGTITTHSPAQ
jgi:hypothetical protein